MPRNSKKLNRGRSTLSNAVISSSKMVQGDEILILADATSAARQRLRPHRYPTRTTKGRPLQELGVNNNIPARNLRLFKHLDSDVSKKQAVKSPIGNNESSVLASLPIEFILCFLPISSWAFLCRTSSQWCHSLRSNQEIFRHLALSVGIRYEPLCTLLPRLLAVERLASPQFQPTCYNSLIDTPVGGGIWCLELHQETNLLFAGCWGPSHQVDLIKCWDAATGTSMGSLYGHFSDVKCLKECGSLLYSGSYDGTIRCWNVALMEPYGDPYVTNKKPVLALIATKDRLYAGYESGSVRCWDVETHSILWNTSHPGPVTAISLNGTSHIVSAFTCSCFNGIGFSLKKLAKKDGKSARGLLDEEWSPRKSISFLHGVSEDNVLVGFAAPLGTVASGAVVSEHEVGRVLSVAGPQRSLKHQQLRYPHRNDPEGDNILNAPAWGLECFATHGGNLSMGTDNGTVVVSSQSGRTRHRVFDVCGAAGYRPSSAKVSAIALAGTKVFVALQSAAGDRDVEGHRGRLLCFELVPEFIPTTWM